MKIIKNIINLHESKLEIHNNSLNINYNIIENSYYVDGIGGIVWDGSILTIFLLNYLNLNNKEIIELGCGTGLCGIYCILKGSNVILTDREIDLAQININSLKEQLQEQNQLLLLNNINEKIQCYNLVWGENISHIPIKQYDLIIVCECACLVKQQESLIQTIIELTNDKTVILVTFDGIPPPNDCNYESKFISLMQSNGYHSKLVLHSQINWYQEDITNKKLLTTYLTNISTEYQNLEEITPNIDINTSTLRETTDHHITVFYRPTATNTCSRCHCQYLDILNSPTTSLNCRYHPGYYVCRKHPGETRLSINGYGDSLGYYGNGEEGNFYSKIFLKFYNILSNIYLGWPAKFWDCCGSEDPNCIGCKCSSHIPYS